MIYVRYSGKIMIFHAFSRIRGNICSFTIGSPTVARSELPELQFPKIGKLFDTFSHLFVYFLHGKSARNREISSRAFKNVARI